MPKASFPRIHWSLTFIGHNPQMLTHTTAEFRRVGFTQCACDSRNLHPSAFTVREKVHQLVLVACV